MGRYIIIVEAAAQKDLKILHRSGSKADIRKVEQIFRELAVHPTRGTGRPEQLRYDKGGYWSRRINNKDRLIYKIEEAIVTVTIVSARGHYSDK